MRDKTAKVCDTAPVKLTKPPSEHSAQEWITALAPATEDQLIAAFNAQREVLERALAQAEEALLFMDAIMRSVNRRIRAQQDA